MKGWFRNDCFGKLDYYMSLKTKKEFSIQLNFKYIPHKLFTRSYKYVCCLYQKAKG